MNGNQHQHTVITVSQFPPTFVKPFYLEGNAMRRLHKHVSFLLSAVPLIDEILNGGWRRQFKCNGSLHGGMIKAAQCPSIMARASQDPAKPDILWWAVRNR